MSRRKFAGNPDLWRAAARASDAGQVTTLGVVPPPEPEAIPEPPVQVIEVATGALVFEDQPRKLLPPEEFARLRRHGPVRPRAVLERLQELATAAPDSYWAGVLAQLESLARTIRAGGVYDPIWIIQDQGVPVVKDGHRRVLAALLADQGRVHARLERTPLSPAALRARQLAIHVQRADWTDLEKARALCEMRELVAQEQGLPVESHAVLQTVLDAAGLSERRYYQLVRLSTHLAPEAQAKAGSYSERVLRPLLDLAPEQQVEALDLMTAHGRERPVTAAEVERAVALYHATGDLKRAFRLALQRADTPQHHEPVVKTRFNLIRNIPENWPDLLRAVDVNLSVLPPPTRQRKLRDLAVQQQRAAAYAEALAALLRRHGWRARPADEETA